MAALAPKTHAMRNESVEELIIDSAKRALQNWRRERARETQNGCVAKKSGRWC
jgi:hypothetical protein